MKIIAIGDVHGWDSWKKIVAKETFDKVVFIGDYFDSFSIEPYEQQKNFMDIIQYKREYKDKVVLLLGNHDYHYLSYVTEKYSGFKAHMKNSFAYLLDKAVDERLIQMCFIHENVLYSHAGVTRTWCDNNGVNLTNVEESINDLFYYTPRVFEFTRGFNDSDYGDDVEQSPIWVRRKSLLRDKIDGYTQVVGHTVQDKIYLGEELIMIDTLGSSNEYLIWEDGKFVVGKI